MTQKDFLTYSIIGMFVLLIVMFNMLLKNSQSLQGNIDELNQWIWCQERSANKI